MFNRSTVIQSNDFPNEFGMGFGSRAQSPDILQAKSSHGNKPQSLMPKIQNDPINNSKKGRRNITMTQAEEKQKLMKNGGKRSQTTQEFIQDPVQMQKMQLA